MLRLVRAAEPRLALNALTNTDKLEVHQAGASPWLAGLDIDDFADSVAAAVSALGFDAISPSHTILTPAMIAEAHEAGLRVLPYTVDNEPMMRHLIDDRRRRPDHQPSRPAARGARVHGPTTSPGATRLRIA